VICFSVYNWNRPTIINLTRNLKSQINHDVIVIVGGPSIEAHGTYDWRQDYEDADYAVFSDGEQAFHDILCHHFYDRSLNILNTHNLLWVKNDQLQKAPAAYIKNTEYSPYLESQHLLKQMVGDPEYHGYEFELSYETSRGCPYSCSFCDWTSGLGPTTVKRKVDYRAELEMIAELGITQLHISDANFGQWPVDVEIARLMAEILPPRGIKTQSPNLSKNKKDRAYEILEIWIDAGVCEGGKFAVQDIDPTILANIDRPDISWEEHKTYIRHLKSRFPDRTFSLEGIKGLPGQTRKTWQHLLREAYQLNLCLEFYTWIIIPNSPAVYDPEYMKKFQIRTREIKNNKHSMISGSFSFNELDIAYFNFTQITYKMLSWFGVTLEEFDEFNKNIPPLWEKKYFTQLLLNLYNSGSVSPRVVNQILREVFSNHALSGKYADRWQEFLDDSRTIHRGYHSAGIA
jgi:putative methyltransferase